MSVAALLAASVSFGTASVSLAADEPNRGSELSVPRLTAPVRIDGDLSDPAWKDAARVTTFYEINVADSGPPPVPTTAYIAYDAEALYLAFDCSDPDPRSLRAYYSERDNVFSEQDFVGVILDTRHDGRSALELFINAYGIVDDGWVNDATGREDFSPDLFWDTAGKIDERGWTVEARLPFSSLRYRTSDGQTKMGIIFYRNYPREYRFQMFSVPLPRNANCFVCRSTTLTGFTGLPLGHHLVVAPYGSVSVLGSQQPDCSWRDGPTVGPGGADIKWVPNADTAVDLALNPDFSQVESDTAQPNILFQKFKSFVRRINKHVLRIR